MMEATMLLDSYLHQLRLPTFLHNYQKFAEDAARSNQDYTRFLLALAEQEVAQRERNRIERRIKAARFPVLKELADFDFSAIPSLNKAQVLDLARGEYISRHEPILMIGACSHFCGSKTHERTTATGSSDPKKRLPLTFSTARRANVSSGMTRPTPITQI